jgi:alkaline phosphatase
MRDKLVRDSGMPGSWTLVERLAGQPDGPERLLRAATDPSVERLLGLFGGPGGNLDFRLADGSGRNLENPTLAELTSAALAVLGRKPRGFALLIEGGAIDWAAHGNDLNRCVGELLDFNDAVAAVAAWVEDPSNGSDWTNTLVLVTGDHECGYLTAGPQVFADRPLGEVSGRTLALEKPVVGTGYRASWDDLDHNDSIDIGEPVYWAWNSIGHSNSLIPLHARGLRADGIVSRAVANDPVRGRYLDNVAVFEVLREVVLDPGR